MKFGQRMRERREELGLSRAKLADCLNVSMSAISNYENGVSFPREEILLRVFDCLRTDPNATVLRAVPRCQTLKNGRCWKITGFYPRMSGKKSGIWRRPCASGVTRDEENFLYNIFKYYIF